MRDGISLEMMRQVLLDATSKEFMEYLDDNRACVRGINADRILKVAYNAYYEGVAAGKKGKGEDQAGEQKEKYKIGQSNAARRPGGGSVEGAAEDKYKLDHSLVFGWKEARTLSEGCEDEPTPAEEKSSEPLRGDNEKDLLDVMIDSWTETFFDRCNKEGDRLDPTFCTSPEFKEKMGALIKEQIERTGEVPKMIKADEEVVGDKMDPKDLVFDHSTRVKLFGPKANDLEFMTSKEGIGIIEKWIRQEFLDTEESKEEYYHNAPYIFQKVVNECPAYTHNDLHTAWFDMHQAYASLHSDYKKLKEEVKQIDELRTSIENRKREVNTLNQALELKEFELGQTKRELKACEQGLSLKRQDPTPPQGGISMSFEAFERALRDKYDKGFQCGLQKMAYDCFQNGGGKCRIYIRKNFDDMVDAYIKENISSK